MRTTAALISAGAGLAMALAGIGVTTVGAATPSCGRPENAPGFGTPARAGVVPNTVCMDLRLARDKSHAAGYYNLRSQDATGRGRHPIIDRDWTVTGQSPPPGGRYPKSTRVVLKAVKDAEASSCA